MNYVKRIDKGKVQMSIKILPDENCIGQVDAIFNKFEHLGYVELLEVELLT